MFSGRKQVLIRYLCFIAIGISVLIVAMGMRFARKESVFLPGKRLQEKRQCNLPDTGTLEQAEKALKILAAQPERRIAHVDFDSSMFVNARLTRENIHISGIFNGQGKRYAVIDGRVHTAGSTLPGGSRIIAIERDRVVFSSGGRIERVFLDSNAGTSLKKPSVSVQSQSGVNAVPVSEERTLKAGRNSTLNLSPAEAERFLHNLNTERKSKAYELGN